MSSDKNATGKGGRLARSTGVFPSFPTPCADDSTRASETHTSPLNKAVFRSAGLWPTPTATDAEGGGSVEQWEKRRKKPSAKSMGPCLAVAAKADADSPPQDESKNYCLYPPWVEWLMGWPVGWTSLSPMNEDAMRTWADSMLDGTWFELAEFWEMPKMAKKTEWPDYKARLKALGNGQVSIVAHAIWEIATKGVSSMADRLTKQQRSTVMRSIKGKNTWMEKMVSLALRKGKGMTSFKMNDGSLPGSPDIVFHSEKVAVFLDGCFWHGCPKCYKRPQSNQEFWDQKLENTKKRDVRNEENLKAEGWSVIRLWEHEIKADCAKHVDVIVDAIRKRGAADEIPETGIMRRTKFS
jgi:DNA mismatch endonuclease (patch repair protein)